MEKHSNISNKGTESLSKTLPLFPLDGAVLFPRGRLPLNIFETRYLNMVSDALNGEALIGMIQPLDPVDYATKTHVNIYGVGCAGRIVEHQQTGDGRYLIVLEGLMRFRIVDETTMPTDYRQAHVSYDDFTEDQDTTTKLGETRAVLLRELRNYLDRKYITADWQALEALPDGDLVHALAMTCPFPSNEKQALLEALTLDERARVLLTLMALSGPTNGDPGGTPAH